MTEDQRTRPPLFGQIDVTTFTNQNPTMGGIGGEIARLLRELLAAQDRQNELLEEVVSQLGATQRQRANELGQWKQANPELARRCKRAAEALNRVQNEFLQRLTDEVTDNEECLADGDFMLDEFMDRFGPRLAQLNGVLQVLSQLGHLPEASGGP